MFNLQLVFYPYLLEGSVYPLDADDAAISVQEAWLVVVLDVESFMAVVDVTREAFVDSDFPTLASLLFPELEGFLVQNVRPFEGKKVGDTETEEDSTTDEKGHTVIAILVQSSDKVGGSLEWEIVCRCVRMFVAHSFSFQV